MAPRQSAAVDKKGMEAKHSTTANGREALHKPPSSSCHVDTYVPRVAGHDEEDGDDDDDDVLLISYSGVVFVRSAGRWYRYEGSIIGAAGGVHSHGC